MTCQGNPSGRRHFLGTAAMTLAAVPIRPGRHIRGESTRATPDRGSPPCDGVAQFATAVGHDPARQGRARPVRHLYVHQLAAHAPVCSRVGPEVQARIGRDRRAHARVRIRKEARERASRRAADEARLPDRGGQRLCDLARLRQSILARALLHRCAWTPSRASLRRRRVRAIGKGDSWVAGGNGCHRRRQRRRADRCERLRAAG